MLPPGLPTLRLPRGRLEVGCLLVASPMLDAEFERTVVLLLDHDEDGSLGVILNRISELLVDDVVPHWSPAVAAQVTWPHLFQGGPVADDTAVGVAALPPGRFGSGGVNDAVPGAPRGAQELLDAGALRPLGGGLWSDWALVDLDADVDAVASQVQSMGIFAGYAGWSPDQLQDEIDEGAWYVVGSSPRDLTQVGLETMWSRVLRRQRSELAFVGTLPDDPERN